MKITPDRLQECINDLNAQYSLLEALYARHPDPIGSRLLESLCLASQLLAALPGDVEVKE